MNQDENTRQKISQMNRIWLILLLGLAIVLPGVWLWFTPGGFWGKTNALGYSVCHQITDRSFTWNGQQSPLCARCAGMYLGALLTLLFHFFWGKHGKFPPWWVLTFLGLGVLAFAMDGLNSAISGIVSFKLLYETTNLTRLATGFGIGLGIGSIIAPIFNQTVWKDWLRESSYEKSYRFPLLLGLLAMLGWTVYNQIQAFFTVTNILMGVGILFTLWTIHTTLATLILKRANLASHWHDLRLPALLGFVFTSAQIGLISLARYLLTGTFAPLNL